MEVVMGTYHRRKGSCRLLIVIAALMLIFLYPGATGRAASVTCKTNCYVTTKINKSKLKKGKKAKVKVTVTNTSGKLMKNLSIRVLLPSSLKKTKGSLTKTKASLGVNSSYSFTFYVKAKKKVTFKKTVTATKNETDELINVTANNLIMAGKTKNYMKVTFGCTTQPAVLPSSYAEAMVSLLANMKSYAKKKDSGFAMISNGGYNLYAPGAGTKSRTLAALDGVLIEDAFTNGDKKAMQAALKEGIAAGKKAFSIEYKSFKGDSSIISYKAPNRKLNKITSYTKKNAYDVSSLSDVKDFMAIFDPKNYKTKKAYFDAINNTDYDLVFIDLFYGFDKNGVQVPLTASEVNSLKKKKNGGKRMVCTYLSVGEAEDYRYYWLSAWNQAATRPAWIAEENEDWDGNYKVRYWDPAWQSILYGYENSYLDKIMAAGFDGVYLDVIDAYEYFEHH